MVYCKSCGKEIKEKANFCSYCGKPKILNLANAAMIYEPCEMDFSMALSQCFKKYVDFNGRASRAEFWWFVVFSIIVRVSIFLMETVSSSSHLVLYIVALILLWPELSVTIRRLHDTNHSGWLYLLVFTIIGIIPLFIWWMQSGDNHDNHFGSKPNC